MAESIRFDAKYIPVPDQPLTPRDAARWLASDFNRLHAFAHTGGGIAQAFGRDEWEGACWLMASELASLAAACGRAIGAQRPLAVEATLDGLETLHELVALAEFLGNEGFDVKWEAEQLGRALNQRSA